MQYLVLDEDGLVRRAVSRNLGRTHDVLEAANAGECLQMVDEYQVQVVLADESTLRRDRDQLVSALRARGVQVVVMSTNPDNVDGPRHSYSAVITKPLRTEELQSTLSNLR